MIVKTIIFFISFLILPASAFSQDEVKIVVTAAFVSERGMPIYNELAEYISQELNQKTSIVSNLSYQHSNLLLDKGIVQVGFVCGLPYTHKKEEGTQELIAIPIFKTTNTQFKDTSGTARKAGKYYSYTIVHKDSKIRNWKMLKGKSFAYNDQLSNSGYNMPRYKLISLGAKSWNEYFNKVVVSGSHEESIRMVAEGLIDASSVDSLVLDFDRSINEKFSMSVKVIETLFPEGAGVPPVVMSTNTPVYLREKIRKIFLNMHNNKRGKEILDKALLLRFDKPQDSNYDDIRLMEQAAKKAGFIDHVE